VDNQNLDYNLPTNAYTNFDATSLKSFMISRLNDGGVFTDQNYEGSNLSSIIEILAYYTHVLMFYLNQTASESMFSQATIYENMNKIVKMIGYKPTGKQTAMCPINCVASASLTSGNYLLRKYSYFLVDNIQYTLIKDQSFEKSTNDIEIIDSINTNTVLYQGTVGEYPIYTADGIEYENFAIVVDNLTSTTDTRFISHGTISVYVKEVDNETWYEYSEVDSLFLSNSDRVYDLRLNENGHYEVKFGNGIFGKRLNSGDEVAVFYILSDGQKGQISKNAINGNKLFTYNSSRFSQIYSDIITQFTETVITNINGGNLTFNNPSNSTVIQEAETVEGIRENAPVFLASQIRLVTESDYENYLKKSIPNIVNDIKVVNNNVFLSEYIDYFYKICVDPNKSNRVILNQVNFADSCDFNNINIFCVPPFINVVDESYPDFMSDSYKTLIKTLTNDKKIISNEIVPRDPVYVAFDIGFTNTVDSINVYNDTQIVIVREANNKTNKETIKSRVASTIVEYFKPSNNKLGQTINISELASNILGITGVKSIKTVNTKDGLSFNGLSFITWNPMFEGVDISLINQTTTLPFFKFPYFYRPNSLINKIVVIDNE
jgi:hypothetical protein